MHLSKRNFLLFGKVPLNGKGRGQRPKSPIILIRGLALNRFNILDFLDTFRSVGLYKCKMLYRLLVTGVTPKLQLAQKYAITGCITADCSFRIDGYAKGIHVTYFFHI